MLQFSNSFKCLTSKEDGSVVLRFYQNEPDFADDDTEHIITTEHELASIIINQDGAKALFESLKSVVKSS